MAQYSILSFVLSISITNSVFIGRDLSLQFEWWPYKKLLICVQQKVIYDGKKYFWKILTLIQMKPTTLMITALMAHRQSDVALT